MGFRRASFVTRARLFVKKKIKRYKKIMIDNRLVACYVAQVIATKETTYGKRIEDASDIHGQCAKQA